MRSFFLNLLLVTLLMQLSGFSYAVTGSLLGPNAIESIKATVKSLKGKKVKVTLMNLKTAKGTIFDIGDKEFKVGHRLDPGSVTVRYEDILEIRQTKTKWFVYPIVVGGAVIAALLYASYLLRGY